MVTIPASPRLSIVVIVYNMGREAPRTLRSLSVEYQQGVTTGDYEVIVVENGSAEPFEPADIAAFGENFRYLRIADASPSPAGAMNRGVAMSTAPNVGVMIDGARMATPGIVARTLELLDTFANPVVTTIALHLGPDIQNRSISRGYDKKEEDRLLQSIDWPSAGYRLFEIGTLAPSSGGGWLAPLAESNLMFMRRGLFDQLGGMDEMFTTPGGGLVNLDLYNRICELSDIQLVCLFGEATFHQLHGGIMTNRLEAQIGTEFTVYSQEYHSIRGKAFASATRMHMLYGAPPQSAMALIRSTSEQLAPVPASNVMASSRANEKGPPRWWPSLGRNRPVRQF